MAKVSLKKRPGDDAAPEQLRPKVEYANWEKLLQCVLAAAWIAFQLYVIFKPMVPMIQRPVHVMFAVALIFLWKPLAVGGRFRPLLRALDMLCVAIPLAMAYFFIVNRDRMLTRMVYIDPVLPIDIALAILLVILLLEATRRTVGYSLFAVVVVFLFYGWFGRIFPGWLGFRGIRLTGFVEILFLSDGGIFGIPVDTSLRYVFYFVLFGAIYSVLGGSRLLIELGLGLTRNAKGGAAKSAVIASSLMGTVSGSAVANVTTTGVFTIPFMIRSGETRVNAAATEAIASTGGQLMPPIMGIAAFVMAEFLGIPYSRIALAGVLPALLFYVSVFFLIDFSARRRGIGKVVLDQEELKFRLRSLIHMIVPLLVVIYYIIRGSTPTMAAVFGAAAALVVGLLRKDTRLTAGKALKIVQDTGRQAATVAIPIATIGIIVAVAIESNLALKFSNRLMFISGGSVFLSLFFVVLGCIILGMGLPTVAAYIMGAVFFAPPLTALGFDRLAVHFFVFYYSVLAMITPPVALASFTAGGLAEADVTRTGLRAFVMSIVAFLIPFIFIFRPELLWSGPLLTIIERALYSLAAAVIWAGALAGYIGTRLSFVWRTVLGALALVVFLPVGTVATYAALVTAAAVIAWISWWQPRLAAGR
ncbi:MAG: TRAP transporter fused permease subunit [Spirochaetaceae bacterium]|nr:MAG: TRAP transporter fused permease subunit [Spirochaetaceae bacterium]